MFHHLATRLTALMIGALLVLGLLVLQAGCSREVGMHSAAGL